MNRITRFLIALPTLIGSMFSCSLCPMCIPMYASIFAAMGINIQEASPYLIIVMLASMMATLTLIYTQIRKNHLSWMPLWVAAISAGGIIYTKCMGYTEFMYASLASFFFAALWNRTKGSRHYHKIFHKRSHH